MPTATTTPLSTKQRVQLYIDGSEDSSSGRIDSLLTWIESFPNHNEVEVHLNTGRKSEPTRRLQRTLQTLGCTVVTRYWMPAIA